VSVLDSVKFDEKGLVTAVARDAETGQIVMLAYMNKEALQKTIETRTAHYYSRSRQKLWLKGESSGHTQKVQNIYIDCDGDAILIDIKQESAACHKGYFSCFYREITDLESDPKIIQERVFDPESVY